MRAIFSEQPPLSLHEKMVVLLFSCFLFVLIKFAFRAPDERWPQGAVKENFTKRQIVIWIYGEIENEGRYHFNEGDAFKVVLGAVSVKEGADLRGLDYDKPLKTGQRIKIKKLHKLLVDK